MKNLHTTIVHLLIILSVQVISTSLCAQDIRIRPYDRNNYTTTKGGITFSYCYDASKPEPNEGTMINGKLVVPCKYSGVLAENGYFEAFPYPDNYSVVDIYTPEGQFLLTLDHCLLDITEINGRVFFKDARGMWYDKTGKFICRGNIHSKLISDNNGELFVRTDEGWDKNGISDIDGNIILAPEFQKCDYLGDNLFSFKMNGYWGVMKKDGTIIIPLSRQYSSISYSRTFKTFTFEKRVNNVVYKGECNANGVQTVIQKDHTITSTPATKTTTTTQPAKTTTTQPEKKTEPTPAPQPQPRQPQPMQVWVQCYGCNGSGQCHICGGLGWKYTTYNSHATCTTCGGNGKCNMCAGHGGHNEIQYR